MAAAAAVRFPGVDPGRSLEAVAVNWPAGRQQTCLDADDVTAQRTWETSDGARGHLLLEQLSTIEEDLAPGIIRSGHMNYSHSSDASCQTKSPVHSVHQVLCSSRVMCRVARMARPCARPPSAMAVVLRPPRRAYYTLHYRDVNGETHLAPARPRPRPRPEPVAVVPAAVRAPGRDRRPLVCRGGRGRRRHATGRPRPVWKRDGASVRLDGLVELVQ